MIVIRDASSKNFDGMRSIKYVAVNTASAQTVSLKKGAPLLSLKRIHIKIEKIYNLFLVCLPY